MEEKTNLSNQLVKLSPEFFQEHHKKFITSKECNLNIYLGIEEGKWQTTQFGIDLNGWVMYVSDLKISHKIYMVICKLLFILFILPDWLEMAALTWWLTFPTTTLSLSMIIMWFGGQLSTVELLSSLISRYALFLKYRLHEDFYFHSSLKSVHRSMHISFPLSCNIQNGEEFLGRI